MPVVAGRSRRNLLCAVVCFCLLVTFVGVGPALAKKPPAVPPKLGISMVELYPDLAADLGLGPEKKGIVVLGVSQGSPAEAVKLQPGDLIIRVQKAKGKPVDVVGSAAWSEAIKGVPADQQLRLTVLRAGQELTVPVKLSTAQFGPYLQPPAGSEPRVIKVVQGGGGDARTLHGGVLKARPGDTLLLQGSFGGLEVWLKDLTVASLDPAKAAVVQSVYVNGVSGVRLTRLAIVAPKEGAVQNGVWLDRADGAVVENCWIEGFAYGIGVTVGQGVVLDNNTLTRNTGAIVVDSQAQIKIVRNFVRGNAVIRPGQSYFTGGISIGDAKAEIVSNTIIENSVPHEQFPFILYDSGIRPGTGIVIWSGAAQVYNNIVAKNNIGIMVATDAQASVEYNDVYGHLIQSKVWSPKLGLEVSLSGGNSNFLSGITSDFQMPPGLFTLAPNRRTYTLTLQFQPSSTNGSVDPLFADPLNGDFRLAADSPLVNKGRGGTYLGAFPPVGYVAPGATAGQGGGSGTGGQGAGATGQGATGASGQAGTGAPAAQAAGSPAGVGGTGSGGSVQIQEGVLYIPPQAVDGLVERLAKRVGENPTLKERVAKAPVGIVPFGLIAAPGLELSRDLGEDLATALINGGFRLANQGQVEKALTELGVRDSSQVSGDAALEIGRRLGGVILLVGTVSDRAQTVVVNVRLLDTASGEFLAAERVELAK